jgi:hypothetical protein
MSSIAQATLIPKDRLYHVVGAALPKRRLFRKPVDEFDQVLEQESLCRTNFTDTGAVLATVLSYLDDNGIGLLTSELEAHAASISTARQSTCFIFTNAQREALGAKLASLQVDHDSLRQYWEDFHETAEPEAGSAMASGIAYVSTVLDLVKEDVVAIVTVG